MSSLKLRKKARRFLVQAIYQWQLSGAPVDDIAAQFLADNDPEKFDLPYFQELLFGIINHVQKLDDALVPFIHRELKTLDPVELAILRVAIYELMFKLDIPYRVVINEAVEQAKRFGATDGHKFVNGVLDKVAQNIRKTESPRNEGI